MKSYPLGVQTFEKIIDKNQLYIDKTKEIYRLIQFGGYYFYARPRRFGKSLMLILEKGDTLFFISSHLIY